jgi:Gram-negative bacterial TonB protein C-terminal
MKNVFLIGFFLGVTFTIKAQIDYGTTRDTVNVICKVEQEAKFLQIVGENKYNFSQFLQRNLIFPSIWLDSLAKMKVKNHTDVITVRFIVCTDGGVCEITTNNGAPLPLAKEAIRIIKKTSGKWKPGMQDGKPVKSYHEQKISFVNIE